MSIIPPKKRITNIQDFDTRLLEKMLKEGMLNKDVSEDGKLVIYSYTNNCIYAKEWNEVTRNLRGHTFDTATGEIVALAFPKFFNLFEYEGEQRVAFSRKKIYKCYEKVDGVLLIIHFYDGKWYMHTKGKFDTPPAHKGKEILKQKYTLEAVNKHYTLLTEILSPDYKIIIDYGDEDKLMLLSAYNLETGKELKHEELVHLSEITGIPLVKSFDYTLAEMERLRMELSKDFEGFVVRFTDDERLKIKSDEYMRVAELVSNLTPLNLWKNMKNGKVKKEVLIMIPEEFREKADSMVAELEKQYQEEWRKRTDEFACFIAEVVYETKLYPEDKEFRKQMGLRMDRLQYKHTVFSILDEKWEIVDKYIMQYIRPTDNEL